MAPAGAVMALGLFAVAPLARAQAPAAAPVATADAPGRWIRAESDHFVVYSDRGETQLRQYVAMLEDFDGVLRILHNRMQAETPRKLPVYLVANTRQLRRAYPKASDDLRGVYIPALDDVFALAIRDDIDDRTKGDDVVLHEYVHHFMMQNFPNGYPGWMIEGLAEYYMTADLQPKKVMIGNYNSSRAYWLMNERWLPMEDLLSKPVGALKRDDIGAFYAQSWLLTHYIWTDKERRAKLEDYLKAVRAGEDPMASWTKVYGEDAKTLERNLKAYTRKPLMGTGITRTPPPPPKIAFTRLPAGADDLILEVQQLKIGVDEADEKAALARVRDLAAKRPGEYYSRLALARAECAIGDRAAGEKILKALLEERPDDLETLHVMAYSRLSAARGADYDEAKAAYAEAVKYLGRAHKVDPDNYLTLYGYAEARSFDREPTANTLDVIFRAAEIVPQNPGIRMNAAQMFIRAGQYSTARRMLAPVAANPHGGGPAGQAAVMLKELEGKEDKPEQPPTTPSATKTSIGKSGG